MHTAYHTHIHTIILKKFNLHIQKQHMPCDSYLVYTYIYRLVVSIGVILHILRKYENKFVHIKFIVDKL